MVTFLVLFFAIAILATLATTSLYMGCVAARANGWRELATHYRHRGEKPPDRLRFQAAKLNDYAFPKTMQIAATEAGLWLEPVLLLFHPPLLVPWSHLRERRGAGRAGPGSRPVFRLEGKGPLAFELELSEAVRQALLESPHLLGDAGRGGREVLDSLAVAAADPALDRG